MVDRLTRSERASLDAVVALAHDLLGNDLLGAYLFGSAVLGGLKPESDLDVLAVTRRPTTHDEKRRLVDRLLQLSWRPGGGGRSRRLELTVVAEPDVRPWRYPPCMDFQYGDWLRDDFAAGMLEPADAESPDLAILITMARQADVPLLGPPAGEALPAVPHRDVRRAVADELDPILRSPARETRNVVLTLARMWCTLGTGEIRSKDAAADWALERLPDEHRAVLARGRAVYVGDEPDRWDDVRDQVDAYARCLADRIRAASEAHAARS